MNFKVKYLFNLREEGKAVTEKCKLFLQCSYGTLNTLQIVSVKIWAIKQHFNSSHTFYLRERYCVERLMPLVKNIIHTSWERGQF